jgi:DNA polymerase-3 subunit delta'
MLAPEGESKVIKIDQIREMVQFVGLSAHYGHSKMVIIEPAEAMNRNAANSLLKTLEEPPPDTQFILVSHMPALLPVTIRSRCQTIRFENPDKEIARQWLAEQLKDCPMNIELLLMLADNAPLEALEIVSNKRYENRSMVMEDLEHLAWGKTDPVEVANRWMKVGLDGVLPWLWKLLEDLIKLQNAKRSTGILNQDFENRLENLASSLKKSTVFAAYDRLKSYHQLIHSATNVTPLTLLEEFTIQWSAGND